MICLKIITQVNASIFKNDILLDILNNVFIDIRERVLFNKEITHEER